MLIIPQMSMVFFSSFMYKILDIYKEINYIMYEIALRFTAI